jgi:hypothetical protein
MTSLSSRCCPGFSALAERSGNQVTALMAAAALGSLAVLFVVAGVVLHDLVDWLRRDDV